MNSLYMPQRPQSRNTRQNDLDRDDVAGERPQIDRVEAPRIVREHFGVDTTHDAGMVN